VNELVFSTIGDDVWTSVMQKAEDERIKNWRDQQVVKGINMQAQELENLGLNNNGNYSNTRQYSGYRIVEVFDGNTSTPIIVLENQMRFKFGGPFDKKFKIIYVSDILNDKQTMLKYGICDFADFFPSQIQVLVFTQR
jgi:hypothetical protein